MSVTRKKKRITEMDADELAVETAVLDEEFAVDKFGPLPAGAREQWERAKRKRGRPKKGKGAKVISVSVERDLLERSDRLARQLGITRAALVARGLAAALTLSGESEPT